MTNKILDNKRIAKNSLMLYMRMLILMCISLFTSRVNLQLLGVTDFGIYNAVGGLVGMFAIISGSMSVAISRFLTYELGTKNENKLNDIFCTSINIQIIMSFIVIIIAETAGLWFLNCKMNIPPDRMYAAQWAFQCSIVTFVVGLISVPYNALIISHEKMSAFAYITIFEAALKLINCYLLYISPIDRLILWAIMLTTIQLILQLIYRSYCVRYFEEAHYRIIFDKHLFKDMSRFIGWATFGNGAVVVKDQGTNILLNIFCGPVVNAARGVAMQVNGVVWQLVNNVMMAVNPQITKSFSSGDKEGMHLLIMRSGKFSFLLLSIIFFPLWANIDIILNAWLVDVPDYTAPFVLLILVYSLLDCFAGPLVTGVLAEGNIKGYEITITLLYTSNVVASYIFLNAGFEPQWVFIMNILFKAFVLSALLIYSKKRFCFPLKKYVFQVLSPSLVVFLLGSLFVLYVRYPIENGLLHVIVSSTIIVLFTLIVIYFVGLNKRESRYITDIVKSKIFNQRIK